MNKKLPQHKDTYFFGYGIDIEKPIELANKIIDLQQENQQLKEQLEKERKVRRKAIEFMKNCEFDKTDKYIAIGEYQEYKELLEILDIAKGE